MPDAAAHLIFWPVAIIGLAADLWTKWAVFNWLENRMPQNFSVIDGFFRFVLALNEGAAFGIAAGRTAQLTIVSVIALIAIFAIFFFSRIRQRFMILALGLFVAGICGNLYDRIFNQGCVRDFIDVYYRGSHWPAFNLADSMLCIAVALILISTIRSEIASRKHVQQQK